MPSYWTPKQERQYGHIKQSCIQRKCRTVRGKKQCVRTCTRMAAATTNKFRGRGLGSKDLFDPRPRYTGHHEPYPRESDQDYARRRVRASAKSQASFDRYTVKNVLTHQGPKTLHELRALPDFVGRPKALAAALRILANDNHQVVERTGKQWRLTDHYYHSHGQQSPREAPIKGLGNVRGKCCVLRDKTRIACFHSKKDAVVLKRSLKKTSGLRIRCV
jgi:hypothetical protein